MEVEYEGKGKWNEDKKSKKMRGKEIKEHQGK